VDGILTRRRAGSLIKKAHALARYWPVHAASWAWLVFTGGTVVAAVLQRLLLESHHSTQRLIERDLAQEKVGRHLVRMASCSEAVTADFVEPMPHGGDTSLASSPDPNDDVFYVYRDRIFDVPYAATKLGLLHLLLRAGAVVRLNGAVARGELTVKIVVPVTCHAQPEDVMAVPRRDVRSETGPASAARLE